MLIIRLFDTPRASIGDRPLARLARREAERLWVYLLLHRDVDLPRERVAFEVWPDVPEDEARARLRRNLHRLQTHLPARSDGSPWIEATWKTVRWNPSAACWIDVEAFQSLCRRSQVLDRSRDPDAVRSCLEQAAELYTGDLLAGMDEPWLDHHRRRLHARHLWVLDQLGDVLEAAGDLPAARERCERLLALDPLHEPAIARAMRVMSALGERTAAIETYTRFRDDLDRAYGIAPSPATAALYEALRSGREGGSRVAGAHPGAQGGASPNIADARSDEAPPLPAPALPQPLSRLIGRRREVGAVSTALEDSRLVTLVGPGGVGKTRLAVAVAQQVAGGFADGVRWVELANIADPKLVVQSVAATLELQPQSGRPLLETLIRAVADRTALLVLDNCEHVVGAAADLAESLLGAAPGLTVLATSRERLGVRGEVVWPVPPLSLPGGGGSVSQDELLASEAVELFIDRVSARWPQFATPRERLIAIADVCDRLEGIPLAIELAAARVSVLPVEEIAARLTDSLALLRGRSRSLPERHQTMTAAIEWSYRLLPDAERSLLRRLSAFVGGFTLDAAEAVCAFQPSPRGAGGEPTGLPHAGQPDRAPDGAGSGDTLDLLAALVDKSLVRVDVSGTGERRFFLLEVIRQFGRAALEHAGERDVVDRLHADFYVSLAERAEPHLRGQESAPWLDLLEREHGNIRAAIQRSRERGDLALALRFVTAVWVFWSIRAHVDQELVWVEEMLAAAGAAGDVPRETVARVQRAAGSLAYRRADYGRARAFWEASLASYRAVANENEVGTILSLLGMVLTLLDDYKQAERCCEEALAIKRRSGDEAGIASAASMLANLRMEQGDHLPARALYESSLSILRRVTGSVTSLSNTLRGLALVAEKQGDKAAAQAYLEEGIGLFKPDVNPLALADWYELYGVHLAYRNRFDEAERMLRPALEIYRRAEHEDRLAIVVENLGELALRKGDYGVALGYLERSLATRRRIGPDWSLAHVVNKLADLRYLTGDLTVSRALAEEGLAISSRLRLGDQIARSSLILAKLDIAEGRTGAAMEHVHRCLPPSDASLGHQEIAAILELLAERAFARSAMGRAVILLGAADHLRDATQSPRATGEGQRYQSGLDRAAESLVPGDVAALLDEGRTIGERGDLLAWITEQARA